MDLFTFLVITILLCALIVTGTVLIATGMKNQPLTGDLTRIGGYTENEYGWNSPQQEFSKIFFHTISDISEYRSYYDVLVLGDSFTFLERKKSWLNFFANSSGLQIAAFNQVNFSLKDIIESPGFQDYPPQLLIYETVERGVINNLLFQDLDDSHSPALTKNPVLHVAIRPLHKETKTIHRNLRHPDLETMISESSSFLVTSLKRDVLGITKSIEYRLQGQSQLFSNIKDHSLLVSTRDLEKTGVKEQSIQSTAERLIRARNMTSQNGKTTFLPLIIPDKLSIYQQFVQIDINEYKALIPWINDYVTLVRTDIPLLEAVANRITDLYMPNDTHTGSRGNRIIAEVVLNWINSVQDGKE